MLEVLAHGENWSVCKAGPAGPEVGVGLDLVLLEEVAGGDGYFFEEAGDRDGVFGLVGYLYWRELQVQIVHSSL